MYEPFFISLPGPQGTVVLRGWTVALDYTHLIELIIDGKTICFKPDQKGKYKLSRSSKLERKLLSKILQFLNESDPEPSKPLANIANPIGT